MKRATTHLLQIVIYIAALLAIEIAVCAFGYLAKLAFVSYEVGGWHINRALQNAVSVNLIRALFYFPIQIPILYVLTKYLAHSQYSKMLLTLANPVLYLLVSVVYSLVFEFTRDYFKKDFFYFILAATCISPLIIWFSKFFTRPFQSLLSK